MDYIVPISKSGDKYLINKLQANKYITCIARLFETIIYKRLQFNLKYKLHEYQHCFNLAKSAETNLCQLLKAIKGINTKRSQRDVIY